MARAVHCLREHLVGKNLASVRAVDDPNVFGKVGTSGAEIEKHLAGKKVVGAGQQGKYFWYVKRSLGLFFALYALAQPCLLSCHSARLPTRRTRVRHSVSTPP